MKNKIAHLIVSLGSGGAERTLYNLTTLDLNNNHQIITLKKDKFYRKKFIQKNIKITEFDFVNNTKILEFFKLVKLLKSEKPDILQTWLYHSDFIGSIAGKLAGIKNIIWNIRGTIKTKMTIKELLYYKLLSIFSYYFPKKIISCSAEAIKQHVKFGYRNGIFNYIPNGIFIKKVKKIKKFENSFLKKYKLNHKIVISMIARYHDQKNHTFLIDSFFELEKYFKDELVLLLIGKNIKKNLYNELLDKNQIKNKVIFLDEVENISDFFTYIDLHVLTSSYGEGFPNVILETLSNKIPNISSDIGDAKLIINNDKLIFEKLNKKEFIYILKNTIFKIKNKEKLFYNYVNQRSFQLMQEYSIENMLSGYRKIWER